MHTNNSFGWGKIYAVGNDRRIFHMWYAHRLALVLAILFLSAASVCADEAEVKPADDADAETIEIPLKEIWASGMPGTQNVHELDPEVRRKLEEYPKNDTRRNVSGVIAHRLNDKSLVRRFISKVRALPEDELPASGLAVPGTGKGALENAALATIDEPALAIPAGEVTVVFFAYRAGGPVYIDEVTRRGCKIAIRYHLGTRDVSVRSDHFALIPVGRLIAGEYEVDIAPLEEIARTGRLDALTRQVCKSFSFAVEKQ